MDKGNIVALTGLVREAEQRMLSVINTSYVYDPYDYSVHSNGAIMGLNDISTYEGQARWVEHFAKFYNQEKGPPSINNKNGNYYTSERAYSLYNSGLISNAILDAMRWPK
jgi:hypothetical protein